MTMGMESFYDTIYGEGAFHGTARTQLQYSCGW